MANIPYAPPNIDFKCFITPLNAIPTYTGLVSDVQSVTGVKITVNTVDSTTIDSSSGYTRVSPTTKTVSPMTLTLYKENGSYALISGYLGQEVTSSGFPCVLTIVYPKVTGTNDQVPDLSYPGFISGLGNSDGTADGIQTFTMDFQPVGAPITNLAVSASGTTATVTFPAGVTVPPASAAYTVVDGDTNVVVSTTVAPTISGQTATLTLETAVNANDIIIISTGVSLYGICIAGPPPVTAA